MPTEKRSQPGNDARDSLDSRVRRLEHLFDTAHPAGSPEATGVELNANAAFAANQRLTIIEAQLGRLINELEPRVLLADSDGGDALTARLMLSALKSALRDCRVISSEVGVRLELVHSALTEASRLLNSEMKRAAKVASAAI